MKVGYIYFTPDPKLAANTPDPSDLSFHGQFSKTKIKRGEPGLVIGEVFNKAAFSEYRLPIYRAGDVIKKRGEMIHTLDDEYGQFAEAIKKIAAYEAKHNKAMKYMEGRMTIRQGWVCVGQQQDSLPWHTDLGRNGRNKRAGMDHVYLVSDVLPTLFQEKAVPGIVKKLQEIHEAKKGLVRQAKPYEINAMTNYCWHSSVPAEKAGYRTFIRVVYESPDEKFLKTLSKQERKKLKLDLKL